MVGNRESNLLSKDILHSLGTNAVSLPLGILLSIFLARLLGPEGKGGYDLFIATSGLLIMILGFSLTSGITYVSALSVTLHRNMVRWLIIVGAIQGLLVLPLLILTKRWGFILAFLPQVTRGNIIPLCAVYVFLTILAGYWRAILTGRQEIIATNYILLLNKIIDIALIIGLFALLHLVGRPFDLTLLVGVLLISSFISNLLFLRRLRVSLTWSSQGIPGFRSIVEYSTPCYIGNLVQFLNYRLDTFLVSALIHQEAVGLYVLAANLSQLLWLIPAAVSTALLPKVAGQQELTSTNIDLSILATRLCFWTCLIAGSIFSLLIIYVLPLVYGEAFRRSVAAFLCLMPGVIIIAPAFILASYFAGKGKPQINLFVSIAGLLATISLDLLLIPRYHIIGAALASTVSYSVSAILTILYFTRKCSLRVQNAILITSEDIRFIRSFFRTFFKRPFL
jgi:O-antigen/teichoic acid export membrane protein